MAASHSQIELFGEDPEGHVSTHYSVHKEKLGVATSQPTHSVPLSKGASEGHAQIPKISSDPV